jgi:hypothetical protein
MWSSIVLSLPLQLVFPEYKTLISFVLKLIEKVRILIVIIGKEEVNHQIVFSANEQTYKMDVEKYDSKYIIFMAGFVSQGILNKNHTVLQDEQYHPRDTFESI